MRVRVTDHVAACAPRTLRAAHARITVYHMSASARSRGSSHASACMAWSQMKTKAIHHAADRLRCTERGMWGRLRLRAARALGRLGPQTQLLAQSHLDRLWIGIQLDVLLGRLFLDHLALHTHLAHDANAFHGVVRGF